MTARRLLVYGAGGHGKVVADVAQSAGYEVAGFIDDAPGGRTAVMGLPVYAWERVLSERALFADTEIAVGIGDGHARQRCCERAASARFRLPTLVHRSAVIAPSARIGAGTVVMALAAVNPDAVVGEGVILNTGCVVEHDCRVGMFAHLSPNVALGGGVTVGDWSHLGLGAVAIPGVRIGDDVTVGAGAAVIRDVPDRQTVVGVPAHPIRRRGGS